MSTRFCRARGQNKSGSAPAILAEVEYSGERKKRWFDCVFLKEVEGLTAPRNSKGRFAPTFY